MQMTKITCALTMLALAISPGLALAGAGGTTCATAQQVMSNGNYSGDTSAPGYSNVVGNLGPLPSPANDAIYTFVSDGMATGSVQFTPQYPGAIFLTTACSGSGPVPLEAASTETAGTTVPLPIDNGAGGPLTAGTTYFIIVSGSPPDGATANGPFGFTTPPLPVELQNFSID